jgi:hypothetical protein
MSPAYPVRLNLGNADRPVLPVGGIGLDVIQAPKADLESCGSRELPLLIFPTAFCCDPEAQADLRCGLAAVFLAGASLHSCLRSHQHFLLPARGLAATLLQLTAVEHRFQVSNDADRLFVANAQKNCSRRRHGFVALDPAAVITAATASGKKLHDDEADHASLQNPATIQGKVTANKRSAARSGVLVAKRLLASHSPAGGADYRL